MLRLSFNPDFRCNQTMVRACICSFIEKCDSTSPWSRIDIKVGVFSCFSWCHVCCPSLIFWNIEMTKWRLFLSQTLDRHIPFSEVPTKSIKRPTTFLRFTWASWQSQQLKSPIMMKFSHWHFISLKTASNYKKLIHGLLQFLILQLFWFLLELLDRFFQVNC